jgi:ABC-type uncharacterized transport system substrate-binding protein
MPNPITHSCKTYLSRTLRAVICILGFGYGVWCSSALAQTTIAQTTVSQAPSANTDPRFTPVDHAGAPWRIAYIETRPFGNYAATLANMITALHKMGWIKSIEGLPFTKGQKDAQVIWDWLAQQKDEPYLKFVENAFYTFDGVNKDKRDERANAIYKRLSEGNDIDLVLIMGSEAAEKMTVYRLPIPILSMSTSNALEAGIVSGAEFSGKEHVWAHMDPFRYKRQLDIFYDIFQFKTLGVVFDDDVDGRSYAALDDVLEVAKERHFKVVMENVSQPAKYGPNSKKFASDLEAAFARLAPQVDAVYLGLFIGNDPTKLAQELSPLTQRKIPVFAQQSNDVPNGALMSLARQNFSGVGRFNARAMVRILKGESPGKIPQIYESSPNIIMNLDVAKAIGYRPRFDLLLGADQIIKAGK